MDRHMEPQMEQQVSRVTEHAPLPAESDRIADLQAALTAADQSATDLRLQSGAAITQMQNRLAAVEESRDQLFRHAAQHTVAYGHACAQRDALAASVEEWRQVAGEHQRYADMLAGQRDVLSAALREIADASWQSNIEFAKDAARAALARVSP